mgnify:CR=1 FL=1
MFQVIFLQADPAGGFMSMLPILAMIVVFYFFVIRPQMNRQKKEKAVQQEMGKGTKVITSSGIHGKVVDLNDSNHIERELMLIKISAEGDDREEVKRLVEIFRGRIIDVTEKTFTIEMTGSGDKLNAFVEASNAKLIKEVVRTGVSGIARGDKAITI